MFIIKTSRKFITGLATTAAALVLTGIPVLAESAELAPLTTIDAQGGTWNYGVGSKYVWSYIAIIKRHIRHLFKEESTYQVGGKRKVFKPEHQLKKL